MADVSRRSFLGSIAACLTGIFVRRAVASVVPVDVGLSQAGSYWFTDVAGRSKFAYRTNNNFTGRKFFPQPMCGGVAAIDYNNDGLMDLFFTNGAKMPEMEKASSEYYNCLLRNK